jgi:hypothetical protein
MSANAANFPGHVTATMCERNEINFLRTGRMCERAVMQVHELVDTVCSPVFLTLMLLTGTIIVEKDLPASIGLDTLA